MPLPAACWVGKRRIGNWGRAVVAGLVLVGSFGVGAAAEATSVTVVMSGTWDYVKDQANLLGGAVHVGTPFTATLVYDDATPDSNPSPFDGNYDIPPAQFSSTLSTGVYTFTHVPSGFNQVGVSNDTPADTLGFYAETYTASPSLPAFLLSYANPNFDDPSGTAVSSDALIGVPWTSSAWASRYMYFFAGLTDGTTYFELGGDITSVVVVPEPGSLALVCVGLALLGRRARRRS